MISCIKGADKKEAVQSKEVQLVINQPSCPRVRQPNREETRFLNLALSFQSSPCQRGGQSKDRAAHLLKITSPKTKPLSISYLLSFSV